MEFWLALIFMNIINRRSEKSPYAPVRIARVFTGPHAKGNPCAVKQHRFAPSQISALNPSDYTQCLSWPKAEGVVVQCWTPSGKAIDCCGHGLLATAALWLQESSIVRYESPITLYMNGSQIECNMKSQDLELYFEKVDSTQCELPAWLDQFFPIKPIRSAIVGGDTGYLVLEWPENFQLKSLPTPSKCLEQVTKRALIVTSLQSTSWQLSKPPQIQLRYFAPQYGVDEDSATGSAMRVLAGYWQRRESFDTLNAYQCSIEGGVLHSHIKNQKVRVSGLVEWLS
ncbi:MAG: PhzF family phenazine biosynthesis protein [Spongiibacteraceae bacterium]|nr:PhzF family phenazine biosynthesis protein [Spongiibacteraceae bacterium]